MADLGMASTLAPELIRYRGRGERVQRKAQMSVNAAYLRTEINQPRHLRFVEPV
jgi:hypothetical protein